jgi:hypothetical protein
MCCRGWTAIFVVYDAIMRAELLLKRLLIAVTLLAAAVFVAPSGAQAHPGHAHDVGAQARAQSPEAVGHKQVADRARAAELAPLSVRFAASGKSASLLAASNPEKSRTCLAGCCRSAGTGCCPAAVPAFIEVAVPNLSRSRLDFTVRGEAGITLGALPEPPKSLA